MAFHAFSTPTNWVYLREDAHRFIYRDADLRAGKVRVWFDWQGGPLVDPFRIEDAATRATSGYRRLLRSGGGQWSWGSTTEFGISNETLVPVGNGVKIATPDNGGIGTDFGTTERDMQITASFGAIVGMSVRHGSNSSNVHVYLDSSSLRVKAGTGSLTGTSTTVFTGTTALTLNQSYTLRVVVSAGSNDYTVYLDGVEEGTFTTSANNTATRGGVLAASGAAIDEFRVDANRSDHSATSYEVRAADTGTVVASGSLDGTEEYLDIDDSLLEMATAIGSNGQYLVFLGGADRGDGEYNDCYGFCSFVRVSDDANMPTPPSLICATGGTSDCDEIARSVAGMGPWRYSILGDADAQSSSTRATYTAAATKLDTYYRQNASAVRPRHTIVTLAQGIDGLPAGTVTAWVNAMSSYVDCWECFNEPNNDSRYDALAEIPTFIADEVLPFYDEVVAADPDAIVLAGCPVSANASGEAWFRKFVELISAEDVPNLHFSVHFYNSWVSIAETRAALDIINTALADFGMSDRMVFQDEQGTAQSGDGGIYSPNGSHFDAAGDYSMLAFDLEVGGFPMERTVRWYDLDHGLPSVPHYWITDEGPTMCAATMRAMSGELYDKTLESALDFDAFADCYTGGVWAASDGSRVLGVRAETYGLPNVRLRIVGADTVTMVDAWGNTDTLTVTNGRVSMPTSKLPTWLRLPSGVSAALIPSDWSASDVATSATPTASGTSTNIARINDGTLQAPFFHSVEADNTTYSGYVDSSESFPQTVTLTYDTAQTLDRCVVHQIGCRNTAAVWRDFTAEISPDGTNWTQVHAFDDTDTTWVLDFTTRATKCTKVSFWRARDVHWIGFDRQLVKAIRFRVNTVSAGGFVDYDTSAVVYTTAPAGLEARWNVISDLRTHDTNPRMVLLA